MLDRLEDRYMLSADGSFPSAVDTNQDGVFEPFDALILLNALNNNTDVLDAPHLDLNEDGALSTADVDLIIGSLNDFYSGNWDAASIAALDDSVISVTDINVSEGETAEVTVFINQDIDEWVEVMVWGESGSAEASFDFADEYAYLSFPPGGQTAQMFSIPTYADGSAEGDETFIVRASSTTGSTEAGSEAIGTVTLQDTVVTLPTLSVSDVTVNEGETATVTFSLDAEPENELFVTYETQDGSAYQYDDYESVSSDFFWYPGDPLTRTVSIPTYTDNDAEGDETFTLQATLGSGYVSSSDQQASSTITILDAGGSDPGMPTISVDSATVTEGETATLTVSVDGPVQETVFLQAATTDHTATTDDYGYISPTTFTFEPGGPTTQSVTIPTYTDGIVEGDEAFTVHISDQYSSGNTVAAVQATVIILDADSGDPPGGGPSLSVSDVTVVEGDTASVTVTLSSGPTTTVYYNVWTESGTASEYDDYDSVYQTISFSPGDPLVQTVSIGTIGDYISEGQETFTVHAGDSGVSGTVTIDDSSIVVPTLTVSDVTVVEGDTASVTVTLSSAPSQSLSLYVGSESITASEGYDYDYVFDFLTFEPDGPLVQTIDVPTFGDNEAEGDETFRVVVSNSLTYESVKGTVTITDVAPPAITVSDAMVMEGEVAQVTISLSRVPAAPLSVNVSSANGTAIAGNDFDVVNATLTFSTSGSLQKSTTVQTFGDSVPEGGETLFVLAETDYTEHQSSGVVTIFDEATSQCLVGNGPLFEDKEFLKELDEPQVSAETRNPELDLAEASFLHSSLSAWTQRAFVPVGVMGRGLTLKMLRRYLANSGESYDLPYEKVVSEGKITTANIDAVRSTMAMLTSDDPTTGILSIGEDGVVYDVVEERGSFKFMDGDLATAIGGVHNFKYFLTNYKYTPNGFHCKVTGTLRGAIADVYDFHEIGANVEFPGLANPIVMGANVYRTSWIQDQWMLDLETHGLAKQFDVNAAWSVKFEVILANDGTPMSESSWIITAVE